MKLARPLFCLLVLACCVRSVAAEEFALHSFERQQLTDVYFSEGANAGDINGDGIVDLVYGPHWYAGPDFKTKQEIYPPVPQNLDGYADNFFTWIYDFNRDGWNDILIVGLPGTPAFIFEHPKPEGLAQHWKKHKVFDGVNNESPQFVNITGDDQPELICTHDGFYGYASFDPEKPFSPWSYHPISEKTDAGRFAHGLGIGDVNGDGRLDMIHPKGWYEQPATNADNSRWTPHEASFTTAYGGAEMYAYDVDGDGDNDIITSDAAHDFGLRQLPRGSASEPMSLIAPRSERERDERSQGHNG